MGVKIIVDISEYNKEWIYNACRIPEEITTEIADAIDNSTSTIETFENIKNEIIDNSFCSDIYNDRTDDEIVALDKVLEILDKHKAKSEEV